jgi:hypothetical protein
MSQKKRVRVYKPGQIGNSMNSWFMQMGGIPQQPQQQDMSAQVMQYAQQMIIEGEDPNNVYDDLVNQGVPSQLAAQVIEQIMESMPPQPAYSQPSQEQAMYNQEVAGAEEAVPDYLSLTGFDEDEDDEDDFKKGGMTKNKFIKEYKKLKLGGQKPDEIPGIQSAGFLGAVQNEANNYKIQKEAEQMYNNRFAVNPLAPFVYGGSLPKAQDAGGAGNITEEFKKYKEENEKYRKEQEERYKQLEQRYNQGYNQGYRNDPYLYGNPYGRGYGNVPTMFNPYGRRGPIFQRSPYLQNFPGADFQGMQLSNFKIDTEQVDRKGLLKFLGPKTRQTWSGEWTRNPQTGAVTPAAGTTSTTTPATSATNTTTTPAAAVTTTPTTPAANTLPATPAAAAAPATTTTPSIFDPMPLPVVNNNTPETNPNIVTTETVNTEVEGNQLVANNTNNTNNRTTTAPKSNTSNTSRGTTNNTTNTGSNNTPNQNNTPNNVNINQQNNRTTPLVWPGIVPGVGGTPVNQDLLLSNYRKKQDSYNYLNQITDPFSLKTRIYRQSGGSTGYLPKAQVGPPPEFMPNPFDPFPYQQRYQEQMNAQPYYRDYINKIKAGDDVSDEERDRAEFLFDQTLEPMDQEMMGDYNEFMKTAADPVRKKGNIKNALTVDIPALYDATMYGARTVTGALDDNRMKRDYLANFMGMAAGPEEFGNRGNDTVNPLANTSNFRPDGQNQFAQYGGQFELGEETEMTDEEIEKFLKGGGKLRFV